MKRFVFMMVALLMCVVSVFAETSVSVEPSVPEFLTGFASFTGLVTVVVCCSRIYRFEAIQSYE